MPNQSKPITIRGITYPTYAAASQALGIKTSTLRSCVYKGNLDHAGLGTKAPRKPRTKGTPITISSAMGVCSVIVGDS